eukprot:scaffold7381_cov310-Pinguiococcus_pyrenoidosus.AAC.65
MRQLASKPAELGALTGRFQCTGTRPALLFSGSRFPNPIRILSAVRLPTCRRDDGAALPQQRTNVTPALKVLVRSANQRPGLNNSLRPCCNRIVPPGVVAAASRPAPPIDRGQRARERFFLTHSAAKDAIGAIAGGAAQQIPTAIRPGSKSQPKP